MTEPNKGEMLLYDAMVPPLTPGDHRVRGAIEVELDGGTETLAAERHLRVEGPRFALSPDEVAGVYPPRNAKGAFHTALPHVVLGRRTLPWERSLGVPVDPPGAPLPWLALLVFEDSQCALLDPLPLEQIVPADVFQRLGQPAGVQCRALEVDRGVLGGVMPSREELALLTHVRRVNVEDRELAAGDSDGWFAVVMSARLPHPGARMIACLVSVEERSDLVLQNPPPFSEGGIALPARRVALETLATVRAIDTGVPQPSKARIVLLDAWHFEVSGGGTFRELMQALDVGMIGMVREQGVPAVTDTGHLPIDVVDRDGVSETAWYRGPLVPHPLTRDELGPYHSADQARRVSPETGAEDISYAAAFELGRLLAAADGRLAQELLRWRRSAFNQAVRDDVVNAARAAAALPDAIVGRLAAAPGLVVGAAVAATMARQPGAVVDPTGLTGIAIGADLLAEAWELPVDEARAILDGTVLAAEIAAPRVPAPPGRIDEVPRDDLDRLVRARSELVEAFAERTREEP